MSEDVPSWLRDAIDDRTDDSDPWTSRRALVAEGRKQGYLQSEVEAGLRKLAYQNDVLLWHGLVAPADRETLQVVIDEEAEAEITRRLLVGKTNRLLADLEDPEEEEEAEP